MCLAPLLWASVPGWAWDCPGLGAGRTHHSPVPRKALLRDLRRRLSLLQLKSISEIMGLEIIPRKKEEESFLIPLCTGYSEPRH